MESDFFFNLLGILSPFQKWCIKEFLLCLNQFQTSILSLFQSKNLIDSINYQYKTTEQIYFILGHLKSLHILKSKSNYY